MIVISKAFLMKFNPSMIDFKNHCPLKEFDKHIHWSKISNALQYIVIEKSVCS